MELTNVFALRSSCRSYTDQQLSEEELTTVLNAGLQTPAAMGRFDKLRFVVVQDEGVLEALNSSFAAATGNEAAYPTYHAPTVIFVACDSSDNLALQGANAACAVEHMALAATDQGLGSVYLFGICNELKNSAQASALLRIPPEFRMVSALAVGVPAEPLVEREPQGERVKMITI